MKALFASITMAAAVLSLNAADSAQSELTAATKKLADAGNYSWKTTVTMPEGAQLRPGPTEGKTDKGLTHVTSTFRENKMEFLIKGDKAAVLNQEGEWQSTSELENAEGRGRWTAGLARSFPTPAAVAAEMLGSIKDLKQEGDAYTGTLNEESAKKLMTRRLGNTTIADASGKAKFWVKDGTLSKMEYNLKGTVSRDGNDTKMDRTTTVEIMDVGKTKVNAPEAATKKLS